MNRLAFLFGPLPLNAPAQANRLTNPIRPKITLPAYGLQSAHVKPIASAGTPASQPPSVTPKNILVIGGTRFSGLYLVEALTRAGHSVTLFNRGSTPIGDPSLMVPYESREAFAERNSRTTQIIGDRTDPDDLVAKLRGKDFDAVFDNNGRELADSKPLIDMLKGSPSLKHYVYMSSAGVYAKSDILPHREGDPVDPNCRHKGKLHTETYLAASGIPYTAIRPVYIYGAGNYNPIEEYFFSRINAGRPIVVPGSGLHLTGLGHVRDLAELMAAVVAVPDPGTVAGKVYNVQDVRAVTFDGMARMCAAAAGAGEPLLVHYDPKGVDLGGRKGFPFRPQHFFADVGRATRELGWEPKWGLEDGLKEAYENDFLKKVESGKLKMDFEADDIILRAAGYH